MVYREYADISNFYVSCYKLRRDSFKDNLFKFKICNTGLIPMTL